MVCKSLMDFFSLMMMEIGIFFIFFSSKIFILLYFIRKTRCTIVIRMVLFPCRFHSLLDSVKFGFIINVCVCVTCCV